MHCTLPVVSPYRLDLTVRVLRRLPDNPVDLLGEDGTYRRAFRVRGGTAVVAVRQSAPDALDVEIEGSGDEDLVALVATMLGTRWDPTPWLKRAHRRAWVARLAETFAGVHPPRYPSFWEACVNALLFQQISLQAGVAIARRFIHCFGATITDRRRVLAIFPEPDRIATATMRDLTALGLSAAKARALRAIAVAIGDGRIRADELERMSTRAAMRRLRALPGIGPWSAALILLRGIGRLELFPPADSGARRSARRWLAGRSASLDGAVRALGPVRGMLYYHLLLARLTS